MRILSIVPLLSLPLLIYVLMTLGAGEAGMAALLATESLRIPMMSGAVWSLTSGGLLVLLAVICLFIEVLKSTRPSKMAMLDNGLSVFAFTLCLILFIVAKPFATTEFFLITMMALLDFLAGSVIMLSAAQRTVSYTPH